MNPSATSAAYTVGQRVTWTSQAAGRTKTKMGVIVAIVPANTQPGTRVPAGLSLEGPGLSRSHAEAGAPRPPGLLR